MAEVSALTPSPPAMADQSVPPPPPSSASSLPPETPQIAPLPVPKSALYGDRAIMAAAMLPPALEGSTTSKSSSAEATGALPQNSPPRLPEAQNESPSEQHVVTTEPPGGAAAPPALLPSPLTAQNAQTQITQTSNATPVAPPQSPPTVVPLSDPVPDAKLDPPAVMVQDLSAVFSAPPSVHSGPSLDTLSYLESVSMMSGTLESLCGIGEDGSSVDSDSELNGPVMRRTDKYGFLGGTQYCDGSELEVSVEVARHREMKWLEMFKNWDKWIVRHFPKMKLRCRKGIPSSLRGRAWQLLSNSDDLLKINDGKFEKLENEPGDPKWLDIIEKDLHRQFPFHEMFAARGGHGQQDLYRILKAYTVYRPDEGYCQAQAPVAAVLLMHMPAEQAFWCLVQICDKYLPGYYSAGLEAIQLDGEIFFSLLRRVCPMAYRHLKKFKIDPILYMTEWFMCIFSRTLPWACVLRVWDMFFCEGVKVVFRVGLVLLKQMLGSVDKLRELQGMYETMERLRNISPESIREELLVHEVASLPVSEALIEKESSVQVRKWRESRGALTHQPGLRLHGTRAIHEQKRRAAAISSGGSLSFLGSSVSPPPPGPLRSSSSLLSLPGFRKSKMPFGHSKKLSYSGAFMQDQPLLGGGVGVAVMPTLGASQTPVPVIVPPTEGATGHGPSPLAVNPPVGKPGPESGTGPKTEAAPESEPQSGTEVKPKPEPTPRNKSSASSRPQVPNQLQPPRVTSEKVTPQIPSPTANNSPLQPCGEMGKKKRRSKDDKKKEREEEKQKAREKKEREKAEKDRAKKEKERVEKDKKDKSGKKKDKSFSAEAEEKNGAAATTTNVA